MSALQVAIASNMLQLKFSGERLKAEIFLIQNSFSSVDIGQR